MDIVTRLIPALLTALLAAPALAKEGYKVPEAPEKSSWLAVLYAFVFLAGACVVAFKNSRRSYLD